jgi:hypothetical protein
MSTRPSIHARLFRAVVIMGAAVTTTACGDSKPPLDAAVTDGRVADAGRDASVGDGQPSDAEADAVLIL